MRKRFKQPVNVDKSSDLDARIRKYIDENQKLLAKHGISAQTCVNFPKRSSLSLSSRFMLWALKKQGAILDIRFFNLKK